MLRTSLCLILGAQLTLTACAGDPEAPNPPPQTTLEAGELRLLAPEARGCEALLEARGGRIASASFDNDGVGRLVTEGDRAGLSVISRDNASLPEVVAGLEFEGELRLLESACYGASGERLPGDGLSL